MTIRQALLLLVDALERELGISPTTAELRRTKLACNEIRADVK